MRFSGVKSIKSGLELCEVPRVQRIYLNYTTKGTHTGDIEGSPETGKEIEFVPEQFFNLYPDSKWTEVNVVDEHLNDINSSVLESAIGRGDRSLCDVIEAAWRAEARFDLWNECFNPDIWRQAFEKFGLDVDELAQREFATGENLPWEHLGGPEKDYLHGHLEKARAIFSS